LLPRRYSSPCPPRPGIIRVLTGRQLSVWPAPATENLASPLTGCDNQTSLVSMPALGSWLSATPSIDKCVSSARKSGQDAYRAPSNAAQASPGTPRIGDPCRVTSRQPLKVQLLSLGEGQAMSHWLERTMGKKPFFCAQMPRKSLHIRTARVKKDKAPRLSDCGGKL